MMNPYLNTPPTKLRRDLESEKDETKRKQMAEALDAWRTTVPGPFRGGGVEHEMLKLARSIVSAVDTDDILEGVAECESNPARCQWGPKQSVNSVALHIIDRIEEDGLLPASPEKLIDESYIDGWFVRSFYKEALAGLVYKEALEVRGRNLTKGPDYSKWKANARRRKEQNEAAQKVRDEKATIREEGIEKMLDELPAHVQRLVRSGKAESRLGGMAVSRRNYDKRVVPGASVLVEFGKRHYHFDSDISGRRESLVSPQVYLEGTVVDPGPGRRGGEAVVDVYGKDFSVPAWRVVAVL